MGLTHAQRGLVVATPVLAGAALRLVMGLIVDHLKPKLIGAIGQVIVMVALFVAWLFGVKTYEQVLVLGLFLGVAGASVAMALPLASRWYPAEHQGKALGIAGAGNSGTALASARRSPLLARRPQLTLKTIVAASLLLNVVLIFFCRDWPNNRFRYSFR